MLLLSGKVAACSLNEFQDATGLALTDEGGLGDELPPITTFLNRILALPIALQNAILEVLGPLLEARIEGAITAVSTTRALDVTAEWLAVTSRARSTHKTGDERRYSPSCARSAIVPLRLTMLSVFAAHGRCATRAPGAARPIPAPTLMLDGGEIESRVHLLRPMD